MTPRRQNEIAADIAAARSMTLAEAKAAMPTSEQIDGDLDAAHHLMETMRQLLIDNPPVGSTQLR